MANPLSILVMTADLGRNAVYTAYQFAGALRRRHRVRLAGGAPAGVWPPMRAELADAIRLEEGGIFSSAARSVLERELRGVDLLYIFKADPRTLALGFWARRRFGIPFAVHLDDWDSGWFSDLPPHRAAWNILRSMTHARGAGWIRLGEAATNRADLLTVSTRALQRRFGGEVVRQGVDASLGRSTTKAEARQAIGIEPHERVVLILGTLHRHKGMADLEASFSRVRTPEARLIIVDASAGFGEMEPTDSARGAPDPARAASAEDPRPARAAPAADADADPAPAADADPAPAADAAPAPAIAGPIDGVEHRPVVPFAEAGRYLGAADLFVVPQRATPFAQHQLPAKMLHAMAFGLPIVATDVGDAREVIGGEPPAGLLVPPGDEAALDEALGRLLRDPDLCRSLGEEGRRRTLDRYGWDAMARQLDALFQERGITGGE